MKLKLIFSAFFGALILLVAYGSQEMGGTLDKGWRVFAMASKTFEYRQMFSGDRQQAFLASVTSAFSSAPVNSSIETITDSSDAAISIPALLYHGIIANADRFNITQDGFFEQMNALHSAGYKTVSIEQFHDFIQNKAPLPSNAVLIVFDDGRKDSYYGAQPILKALGYQATMFVAVEASLPSNKKKASDYYVSEYELKKMIASGVWSIQSHAMQKTGGTISIDEAGTKGNFLSNKMWLNDKSRIENDGEYAERVLWELANSRKTLEEKLGRSVFAFAYPFGDYGQQQVNNSDAQEIIAKSLKEAGYSAAFRQIWDTDIEYTHNYPGDPIFSLKRIEPSPSWSGAELVERLSGGEKKVLPYNSDIFKNVDWRISWGNRTANNDGLHLFAKSDSSGALTLLDGTSAWSNYLSNTILDWSKGSHVSLIGRFKDDKNYVACSFNDKSLKIEQYLNGKRRVMVEKKTFFEMPKKDVELGIMVNKDKVECLVNGNSVIYAYYLSPALSHGGIGLKIWDSELNNSEIIAKKIEVTEIISDNKDMSIYRELSFGDSNSINFDLATSSEWEIKDGAIDVTTNSFVLSGIPGKSSGYFVLGGGYNLTDYKVSSSFDWKSGSSASILARYVDNQNYMECSFNRSATGGRATFYSVANGQRIKRFDSPRLILGGMAETSETSIGISVKGETISCIFNNMPIITYTLPRMQERGTFGFKLWDKKIGSSIIELRALSLEQE